MRSGLRISSFSVVFALVILYWNIKNAIIVPLNWIMQVLCPLHLRDSSRVIKFIERMHDQSSNIDHHGMLLSDGGFGEGIFRTPLLPPNEQGKKRTRVLKYPLRRTAGTQASAKRRPPPTKTWYGSMALVAWLIG